MTGIRRQDWPGNRWCVVEPDLRRFLVRFESDEAKVVGQVNDSSLREIITNLEIHRHSAGRPKALGHAGASREDHCLRGTAAEGVCESTRFRFHPPVSVAKIAEGAGVIAD